MSNGSNKTRTLVEIGMLGAIAVVLMLFEFPIPFIAPPFTKWISVKCRFS